MSERRYKYIVNDPSGGYIVERSIKAKVTARYDYITDRGDYVATESYEERDIVHHGGRTWVCLKPAQGISPGADPAVWAEVGSGRGAKLVPDRSVIVILESKTAEISVSAVDADGAPLPDITASELYEWETDGVTQTAQPNRTSVEVIATDMLRIYTYTVRHESIAHGAQIHVYAVDLATLIQRKDTAKLNELLRVIGVSDPEAYARVVQALTSIKAPYIDKTTCTWWEWDAGQGKYVDTGVSAEGEATYSVTLSSYERVIKEGGEGLRQELKVVTGEKQVTTQGKEVVTSQYSLSAHITVLRGSKELLYSDTVEEGTYTAILRAHGLSASVNAGNIVVTSVGDKGGHVDIEVNCEGKAIITKRFSVVVVKDIEGKAGKYTETRYTYRNAQPDTPQGRHPEGWRVSQRRASEVVVEHGLNGFAADSEGVYTSDYHSQSTASIQYRSTEEIAVQYHLDGEVYGDTYMTVRITDGDRELYSKSYRGRYVDAPKVRMPISDNIRLTITATQSNNQDNYSWVKVSRIEGDKCWESKAVIDPAVHDIEGATESPQWSIPTLYRDYRETSTLTPTSLVIHRNSIGTLTPSQYIVANLNDKGDEVKTNLVLWTSSDGISWARARIESNTAKMTITPTEGIKHYQVRKYKTLPDDVTYNHPHTGSSTASLVEDGANGIGGVMPFPRGEYKVGETYTYDDKYRDIILYAVGGGDMLAYAVRVKGATVTAPPTAIGGDDQWESFSKLSLIATDTALINDAVIGGFSVWEGNLQSQRGRLFGKNIRLQDVPKDKRAKYRPNISLNGNDGEITALGSVVTPWRWGADGRMSDTHVIDTEETWRAYNMRSWEVHEAMSGKVVRVHNGYTKPFELLTRLIIGRTNLGAYNERPSTISYGVRIVIPPGAMLSVIVVPDAETTADYRKRGVKILGEVDGDNWEFRAVHAMYPLCNLKAIPPGPLGQMSYEVVHEVALTRRIETVCAGRVDATGGVVLRIGVFSRSARDGLGRYTIYHSIGHINYAPTITVQAQSGTLIAMVKNLTANYFEVEISNDAGDYEDGAFSFQCVAEV